MAGNSQARNAELVRALLDGVGRHLKDGKRALARGFVESCYDGVAYEDMLEMSPADLEGSALGLFEFAYRRRRGQSKVRVYNPTARRHGWHATHTVVELVNPDRPFLVDSIIAALNRLDLTVHLLIHPVIRVRRDSGGHLIAVGEAEGRRESVVQVQVSQQLSRGRLKEIEAELRTALEDVRVAVDDWKRILSQIESVITELKTAPPPLPADEVDEGRAFLEWIRDDNFTFLGYRDYKLVSRRGKDYLEIVEGSGLGVLRQVSPESARRHDAPISRSLARFARRKALLIITKADAKSTVHRPVYMDYIGVRRFDQDGEVIGEHRLLGLFTSAAYNRNPSEIPLLRRKVRRVMERVGLRRGGHAAKAMRNILDTYPRDELFQIRVDELFEIAQGIRHLEVRQRIRLFVRRDSYARFLSCLVYVPRERYTTALRQRFETILVEAFNGNAVEFNTSLSDAPMARVHFIVRTGAEPPPFDVAEIETKLVAASRAWTDELHDALVDRWSDGRGDDLHHRYREAFQAFYSGRNTAHAGVADIALVERALDADDIAMRLYRPDGCPDHTIGFKLYHIGAPIMLSDVLPMLENMGLRVAGEVPFEVRPRDARTVHVHDFEMRTSDASPIDLAAIRGPFEESFWRVWHRHMEDDGFNALAISARLGWRQVMVIRAYYKYLRQAGITFSQPYIEATAKRNPAVVQVLMRLFEAMFDPDRADAAEADALLRQVHAAVDRVAVLDEDRILRRFVNLVECTLRTNFFQQDETGEPKPYLAFKLDSRRVTGLPAPRPMVEIFIHSPRLEAVHLRGGKVARGGIRWSDRPEDYRTEVLGLMKAQTVKNAVIVPVGSKGGFVIKQPPPPSGDRARDRQALVGEAVECYKIMQRGMLDLTDNLKGSRIVPPARVVRRDGDDPYLVVAADKGTARFSDIANDISASYGHWLGDAYASGGSAGYNHKKMGITARGAWESVKRHFREIGVDTQSRDFTVIGVGDMGGDVFGNGMLLSKHIKLVGAFNHLHIFVDPKPDPAKSWAERKRLFDRGLGWNRYDEALIAKGGGVFDRKLKAIKLTPQIKSLFRVNKNSMTPAELIQAMLRAPVDLLWFGGIGSYVKASGETHAEADDRANDALRVNATEVRAKVFGEGANLAVTQRGRIEYALAGGRLNTDAIDNAAGVDCSDHEVNIKILLNGVVGARRMTRQQRDRLLARMTDEVAALVLRDNYQQTQAISIAESRAAETLERDARFMRALERGGNLDRKVEFLPDDETLAERQAAGAGLTRPELSVLLAYAKIELYDELLSSDLPDERPLLHDLARYFPTPLGRKYRNEIERHPLRREIIATMVSNSLINRVGPTFVHVMRQDTGMTPADIARAYAITRDAFDLRPLWTEIEGLDNRVLAATQGAMHREVMALVERCTRWLLRHGGTPLDVATEVRDYAPGIGELTRVLDRLLSDWDAAAVEMRAGGFAKQGVPKALAHRVASLEVMSAACDLVRIARASKREVVDIGRIYFSVGARFGIDWLRRAAAAAAAESHWQKLAIQAVVEELTGHQSELTMRVLAGDAAKVAGDGLLDEWVAGRQAAVKRADALMGELRGAGTVDLAMLAVANRQLRAMIGD